MAMISPKTFQKLILLTLSSLALVACQQPFPSDMDNVAADKITFDLTDFDENGLYGPPDGKRSLDYEFCIPQEAPYRQEVKAIDPSLNFFPSIPGRIGCTDTEVLAIGNTHQENFRLILLELANLDYIQRIQRVDWE
jgi:hypothetical protein